MTGVLIRTGEDTQTQREEGHVMAKAFWNDAAASQGMSAARRVTGFFPRGFGGSMALLTP